MDIGTKIRTARIIKGLTQEELGQMIGVQKSAIAKYENGRIVNIKRSTLKKLSDVLDIPPYELVYDHDIKNPPAEPQLTEGEEKLLKLIRLMPEEMKKQYIELLESTLKALGLIQ